MTDLNVAYCISMYEMLNKILFTVDKENKLIERDIPFATKYKLQKNLKIVSKEYEDFITEKNSLITKYGEEKDSKITVTDENSEKYKEDMLKVLSKKVEHEFSVLNDEEISAIKDVDIECYEMDLFIEFFTENN